MSLNSLSALLSLAVMASASYQNVTFANEFYDRAGYVPQITGPVSYEYLNWAGISDIVFPFFDGISPVSQPEFHGCDGLCPSSFPYGLQFNTTEPKHSVNLTHIDAASYGFDLYSLNFGCFAIGPNGTDAKGHKTFGRVARDCDITTKATTSTGKHLSHIFHFKAKASPSNLTFGAWPATFRNLTSVYFNATSKPTKQFPYATVVAYDDLSYGADISDE